MTLNADTRNSREPNMIRKCTDVSFIIPVYNGASVIRRMLDSILPLKDVFSFEVIVVDDGSTDETPRILREACKEHKCLSVITQKKTGQSTARNTGLAAAKGEYVFFADADDVIVPEGVAALYHTAKEKKCDVACGTYRRIEAGRPVYTACEGLPDGMVKRGSEDALFQALKTESAFGYLWNKLYRRGFLTENGLRFDDSIRAFMEDQLFNLKAFACGPVYYFRNTAVYEYRFEGASVTRRADPDIADKSAEMLRSYDAFLCEKGIRKENQDLFVPLAMRMAAWAAFKNIEYEGAVFRKIKTRLDVFAHEEALRYMLERKESREILDRIPDALQRMLFRAVFRSLRRKKTGGLAAMFVIGSPVLKAAAKKSVR